MQFGLDLLAERGEIDPGTPEADAFINAALKAVVMHEVGHALGLRHNFRASTGITRAQLRDPAFTKEREEVVALAGHCLRKLQLPSLITTSTEEINWVTDWCLRRNIACVVEPNSYPTATVEDPVCFIRIGT